MPTRNSSVYSTLATIASAGAGLSALLSLALGSGCFDAELDLDDGAPVSEAPDSQAASAAALERADIDRPMLAPTSTDPIADFDMVAGRQTGIPVSWYWAGQIELPPNHWFMLRTVCSGAEDDTIAIVTFVDEWGRPQTRYSDDTSEPEAGMGSSKCSFIDFGYRTSQTRYFVHVISKGRATARASVQYRLPWGPNPNPVFPFTPADNAWHDAPSNEGDVGFVDIGGALIKVGPLKTGDRLEVQTRDNGHSGGPFLNLSDTQMIVFQLPAGLAEGGTTFWNSGIWNDNPTSVDRTDPASELDPAITIPSPSLSFWNPAAPENYVVLGKVARRTETNEGTETRVDLVRGPLDRTVAISSMPSGGGHGAPLWVEPGRYYATLTASTDRPAGWSDPGDARTWNAATARMFVMRNEARWWASSDEYHHCDTAARLGGSRRGQINDRAFVLELWRSSDNRDWSVVQRREIPRASLATPDVGGARFHVELAVDQPAFYKLVTAQVGAAVSFDPRWTIVRNPNASELKLATANMLFNSAEYGLPGATNERNYYRNASNLLATRGSIAPRNWDSGLPQFQVRLRTDQAPFQWETDVINLQEVTHRCTGNSYYCCGVSDAFACSNQPQVYGYPERQLELADTFRLEAESRGSRRWKYVKGRGEWYSAPTGIPAKNMPGFNPVFVADNLWPSDGIYFPRSVLSAAGCDTDTTDRDRTPGNYAACLLTGAYDGDWTGFSSGSNDLYDEDNYAVPARLTLRRFGTAEDRRVVVFNYHGEPVDNDERYAEFQSLMDVIDELLQNSPGSFSNRTDALAALPRNPDLRIIIAGDSNMMTHRCGEHYWIVELLRQHFGYAVDVATANPLTLRWRLGMHDDGSAYLSTTGFTSLYQPDTDDADMDWLVDSVFGQGWRDLARVDPTAHSSLSAYPWWGATSKGQTSAADSATERRDVFLLVGLGWAKDDPVQTYTIMSNQNRFPTDPLHPDFRAVEMFATDCANGGSVLDGGAGSYAPNHALNGCGTGPGKPALHTDHRPVGVRLRVW